MITRDSFGLELIGYTPEAGFRFESTLLGYAPVLAKLHELHSDAGIVYAIAYGHGNSMYNDKVPGEAAQDDRDMRVLDELRQRKLIGDTKKNRFPPRFYKTQLCQEAIAAICELTMLPVQRELMFLRTQEAFYRAQINQNPHKDNPKERKEAAAADKLLWELIEKVNAQIKLAEQQESKLTAKSGQISLDDLFY